MQVQRVQNNYNQTFGAKVSIDDVDKIIPKGVKRTFTKMCRDLGESTDEIYLLVGKGNQNVNGKEMDSFFGMVAEGGHFDTRLADYGKDVLFAVEGDALAVHDHSTFCHCVKPPLRWRRLRRTGRRPSRRRSGCTWSRRWCAASGSRRR